MTPDTHKLAQREINAAAIRLQKAAAILGRPLAITATPAEPRPERRSEPSHAPTRHRSKPWPVPARRPNLRELLAHSGGDELIAQAIRIGHHEVGTPSPLKMELERRENLSHTKIEEIKRLAGLQCGTRWQVFHHAACACQANDTRSDCDCDAVFVATFSNHGFAVTEDGKLEPYLAPEPDVADYLSGGRAFEDGLDLRDAFALLTADVVECTIAGEGENARFIETPRPSDLETRSAPAL